MRCCEPLLECRVLRDEHLVVEIGLQLPAVGRVRLGDVDEDDLPSIPEPLMERLDVARPATKRRSGEAAEDEREWAIDHERVERHSRAILEAREREQR